MPTRAILATALALAACGNNDIDSPTWMSQIADATPLTALSIPGTHDSGALYEPYPGIAKAQDLTFGEQLLAGVRYFDVRCRDADDTFEIFHGGIDENQTFEQVLDTMFAFLADFPSETVVASIKEEGNEADVHRSFEATFDAYVAENRAGWYLADSVPTLGEVRGKLVLLRRFDSIAPPLGIDGSQWQDDTTFTLFDTDSTLRIEDNYIVNDNDMKWAAISNLLIEAASGDPSTFYLTYTSGYQTINGLNNIPDVSNDINGRIDNYLESSNPHVQLGVVAMDFVTVARARAIIATDAR
jgi:1-phosphatidylinositol phosphodiesterase